MEAARKMSAKWETCPHSEWIASRSRSLTNLSSYDQLQSQFHLGGHLILYCCCH